MTLVIWSYSLNRSTFLHFTTTPFDEPPRLTAILVSKFLDDLHEAADKISGPESLSSVSDLEFRIVGSINASLPAPSDDGTPDEAEEGGRENSEGPEPEDGQNSEAVSSSAELEIEEVPQGEAEV